MTVRSLPNLTVVHETLLVRGGSEHLVEAVCSVLQPEELVTAISAPGVVDVHVPIRTSRLQLFAHALSQHTRIRLLLPLAFLSLRVDTEVLFVSFHSGAVFVRSPRGARRILYCHTPPRYLWRRNELHRSELPSPRLAVVLVAPLLRALEQKAVRKSWRVLAPSSSVQQLIRHTYGVAAEVVHPPVDTERFRRARSRRVPDCFLILSRLVRYKAIDLAVSAFAALDGYSLLVAGSGSDRPRLEAMATPNVHFLGHVRDEDLPQLVAGVGAIIVPGVEDFCIAAVEAMAAGTPVIAARAGGLLDTVVPGVTGTFFAPGSREALVSAIKIHDSAEWDRSAIVAHAHRYSCAAFEAALRKIVLDETDLG